MCTCRESSSVLDLNCILIAFSFKLNAQIILFNYTLCSVTYQQRLVSIESLLYYISSWVSIDCSLLMRPNLTPFEFECSYILKINTLIIIIGILLYFSLQFAGNVDRSPSVDQWIKIHFQISTKTKSKSEIAYLWARNCNHLNDKEINEICLGLEYFPAFNNCDYILFSKNFFFLSNTVRCLLLIFRWILDQSDSYSVATISFIFFYVSRSFCEGSKLRLSYSCFFFTGTSFIWNDSIPRF